MSAFTIALLGARYRLSKTPEQAATAGEDAAKNATGGTDQDWEDVDCLCGGTGGRVLSQVDRHGLAYRKVLCTRCGLLRVTPRWTATRYARFYAEEYRDLYSPLADAARGDTLRRLADGPNAGMVAAFVDQAWNRFGDPAVVRPVIVEIGAGGGWNLSRLDDRWTRIGFDSDERFLSLGRSLFRVDLRKGFLAEALPAVADADCVLLSHVLEHVPDPVATLRDIASAARPDALILIEVPGVFRLHRTSLDPMRYWQNAHTFTFCGRTAADTCRRAGLAPLATDEWSRLVLRPSVRATGPVADDPCLARSLERYLRYCEASFLLSRATLRLPLLGAPASRVVRLSADALIRVASRLSLVAGMRNGPPLDMKGRETRS